MHHIVEVIRFWKLEQNSSFDAFRILWLRDA